MKKKGLLLAVIPFLLAGCGESPDNAVRYTVTFANTNMASVKIKEGETLAKPADPNKDGYHFVGWYMEATFVTEVSFPLTINEDTTIYAQYYSYQEAFAKARKNTIGEDVTGYEYDYTLEVSVGYMSAALKGNTTGNAKYNKNAEVSFYDEHVNSGALFFDGTKYTFLKDGQLHMVSLDENDVVKKYRIKDVGALYKYDSSSFAKAVFEYSDEKLKSISKTSVANEYQLKTSFNFSDGVALVGNYVNHPMVEKIIGELPETSVQTGMYVSFSGARLNTYRYEMVINVSAVTLSLKYSLNFKESSVAPTINPKVFNSTYVTSADIATAKAEVNGYLNAYKALEHSSYDFKVKTGVDFKGKLSIDATVDGFTKRKVSSGQVYYLNDYEVDTDHKNADLYKAKGLGDCHGGRVKLAGGEVHDLKKKLLGGYNDVATVAHNDVDNYYLFDVLDNLNNIAFIQKLTDTKKGTVTYAIGGDDNSSIDVLNYFNNNLRLNPLGECSYDVKAFGSFQANSVKIKEFKFNIVIKDGALSEINLTTNGAIVASFPESRDFTNLDDAGFKLTYKLTVTNDGASYEPAETVAKVK